MAAYLDTSVVAKWYLPETGSDAVDAYLQALDEDPVVTSLTVVEMSSLLMRRQRLGHLEEHAANRVMSRFRADLEHGHLHLRPLRDEAVAGAAHLIRAVEGAWLKTLDAIHLSVALDLGVDEIATADAAMATAAAELGLSVVSFVP